MSASTLRKPGSQALSHQVLRDHAVALRGDMAPEPGDIEAAMLLLALRSTQPNVSRLARRLRLPQVFVARCFRHLFDNGVIDRGSLVVLWDGATIAPGPFWADVNVALGRWIRCRDAMGELRWVRAGQWRKRYDYVTEAESARDHATLYYAPDEERGTGVMFAASRMEPSPHWIGYLMGSEAEPMTASGRITRDPPLPPGTPFDDDDVILGLPPSTASGMRPLVWIS